MSRARERLLRRLADRKGRVREGLVLVEGPRALGTALDCGAAFQFVVATPDGLDAPLRARLEAAGVEVAWLDEARLASFAATESPRGPLGVAEEPAAGLPERAGHERVLVLDAVQDPGNVGTLLRAAAAFGAHRVLALDGTVDPWNAKVVRASAGLAFRHPVHRLDAGAAFDWLGAVGLPLVVADAAGVDVRSARPLRHADGGFALLIGNEGAGPRRAALERADALVALPLDPGVESLNAAMAGTVLLWALGPGGAPAPRPLEPE